MKGSRLTALPYVLWSIAFVVIPLVLILVFAMTSPAGGFTLDNLSKIEIGRAHV